MSTRRSARLRREYLYNKANEFRRRQTYERKEELRKAIEDGKYLSASDIKNARALQPDLIFDENQKLPVGCQEDEYMNATESDPLVLITTSRDPSSRLRQFVKEMTHVIPNSLRVNRGRYVLEDLCDISNRNNVTDLILLHEHRGEPDGMIVCHFPYGPTTYFSLYNVVLRHDTNDRSTIALQYPHIIFNGFTSKLGERISTVLKHLFPVPKDESKRTISFSNTKDFISFRHHIFLNAGNEIQLSEVGPRFEMRPYQIKLGTLDIDEADLEWVYRPYQRTAHRRNVL